MPAAVDTLRSGPPELRRAVVALSLTQLVSWGVLYYAFAVVAPAMAREPGWSITTVGAAFSLGVLVSGLSAPAVATLLGRFGPRAVMTAGAVLTIVATTLWASAPSLLMLYLAWALIGAAMAATLYEPAIVVLTLLDSVRMRRAIAYVTVAGGLASTVFVPLTSALVAAFGWRVAVAVLGGGGAVITGMLYVWCLPQRVGEQTSKPSSQPTTSTRRLRLPYMLEQASGVAVTALVVTMLIARGVDPYVAGLVLAASGVGKVVGRLLISGRVGRASPEMLASVAAVSQALAVTAMLVTASAPWLLIAGFASGAAAGTVSVLRPVILSGYVPLHAFASASARMQMWTTFARAAGPLVVAGTASYAGWVWAWTVVAGGLVAAAVAYAALKSIYGCRA
ncbi:MFS transporter [Hoyosella subflava]|uniref:MFS transporter n=1 Tax=Hoyosella subflava TaxID=639313 RepID=UPI00059C26FA|nr:MFS transporter [Hoyosella subflava]